MNSEERLKKNLEDLLASKEFPFDKANWEKAQLLMASEEAFKATLEESLSSKEFPFDPVNWEKAKLLMASEATFKSVLEDSLNSKEFPFDEQNWVKAAGMIRANERPRRVAVYLLVGFVLLGTLLTGFYLFNSSSFEEEKPISIQANTAKPSLKEPREIPKTIADAKLESLKTALETKKPLTKTPKLKTPSESKQLDKPSLVASTSQKILTAPVADTESSSAAIAHVSVTPPVVAANEKQTSELEQQSNQAASNTSDPIAIAVSMNPAVETVKASPPSEQSIILDEKEKNSEKSENTITSLETKTSPKTLVENLNPKNDEDNKEINFIGTLNETSNELPQPVVKDSLVANNEIEITKKTDGAEKKTNSATNSDSTKLSEVIAELPPDNDQGELGRPKEYPVLVSVEAGADYLNGWKNPGSRDARSANFLFGINYFTNIQPKMDLSIGIHYASVGNLSSSNYTSRVTRLGFGEESSVTVFTPVKLHYVLIPMRINYCLTPLNTVGIGFNLGCLLTVDSEIETYTEKFNTKSNQELSKARGYTQGFKKYDSQLSVFYKRRLYPKLAVNLEAFVGLTDIKDNQFFNSNVFERNTGLKLTLVYNFLKN